LVAGSIPVVGLPGFVAALAELVIPGLIPDPGNTVLAGTTLLALDGVHSSATAVAAELNNPFTSINFAGALAAGNSAHMLIAYNDGANTRIADLDLFAAAGATNNTGGMDIHVSDLVQLTGVSFNSFVGTLSTTATTAVNSVHYTATITI